MMCFQFALAESVHTCLMHAGTHTHTHTQIVKGGIF